MYTYAIKVHCPTNHKPIDERKHDLALIECTVDMALDGMMIPFRYNETVQKQKGHTA